MLNMYIWRNECAASFSRRTGLFGPAESCPPRFAPPSARSRYANNLVVAYADFDSPVSGFPFTLGAFVKG